MFEETIAGKDFSNWVESEPLRISICCLISEATADFTASCTATVFSAGLLESSSPLPDLVVALFSMAGRENA